MIATVFYTLFRKHVCSCFDPVRDGHGLKWPSTAREQARAPMQPKAANRIDARLLQKDFDQAQQTNAGKLTRRKADRSALMALVGHACEHSAGLDAESVVTAWSSLERKTSLSPLSRSHRFIKLLLTPPCGRDAELPSPPNYSQTEDEPSPLDGSPGPRAAVLSSGQMLHKIPRLHASRDCRVKEF